MSILFSATYPEKTAAMVLCGSMAKYSFDPDYPWGTGREAFGPFAEFIEQRWGQGDMLSMWAPSRATDEAFKRWWCQYERAGATPSAMRALVQSWVDIDVRRLLPAIRVPTLILNVAGDSACPTAGARFMAELIPGAKFVEVPGVDHMYFGDAGDRILAEVEEFLTGARHQAEVDRVLATIMFTDIVASTERAARMGDRRWRELLESYYGAIRRQLRSLRGREVKTIGDGFLATFDGPARAIRCACAIREELRRLGIEVRAGLHTGEC